MINAYQNRCAAVIRGALGIQRKKQTELSKKIGINRVLLNLFLNRRLDLIPEDIERIMNELGIDKNKIEQMANWAGLDAA